MHFMIWENVKWEKGVISNYIYMCIHMHRNVYTYIHIYKYADTHIKSVCACGHMYIYIICTHA